MELVALASVALAFRGSVYRGVRRAADTIPIHRATDLHPRGLFTAQIARKTWEKANDQIDSCCCLCLGRRNIGASNDTRAASTAGRHDHASRLVMRAGHDTN